MAEKVEFETIEAEYVEFGKDNRNFIEIAKKRAVTDDGETEFVSLSRGYYTPEGDKRFRKSISLPNDNDKLKKVIEILDKLANK